MSNKRKVLIFTPGGAGGAERMSIFFGRNLPKELFDVKYVIIGRLRKIYNLIPDDYPVDCVSVRNKYAFSTLRIWWKIIKEKPDVVFTSQEAYNPRVIIASKLACKKVVVRSSNMIGSYTRARYISIVLTYPWADLLIAQQEQMKKEMIKLLKVNPNKIVTIHNPIDTKNINTLCNSSSPYPIDERIKFVNVGRINHAKAQDIAIRAMRIVKKKIPNAHLYFVGGYSKKNEYYIDLINLVKQLQLDDCIHFIGYDENPYKWVKYADCFVFPSRIEGLPNALIEATYLKVPCVASRSLNIIDDIIKDGQNGFVIPVNDTDNFAQAMIDSIKMKNCKMIYIPGNCQDFTNILKSI